MGDPEPLMDLAKAESLARQWVTCSDAVPRRPVVALLDGLDRLRAERDDLRARLAGSEGDSGA